MPSMEIYKLEHADHFSPESNFQQRLYESRNIVLYQLLKHKSHTGDVARVTLTTGMYPMYPNSLDTGVRVSVLLHDHHISPSHLSTNQGPG